MIIDVHTHLGNVLYPGGGDLILRSGVRKKWVLDPITAAGWSLYKTNVATEWIYRTLLSGFVTRAGRARGETGTLENMRRAMDQAGVRRTAVMPIPPYVTFNDLLQASEADSAITPFTGVDFSRPGDMEAALAEDVRRGAKGLKLHPIVQKISLENPQVFKAVEAFAPYGLPVLFHAGVMSYYEDREKETMQIPDLGALRHAVRLVKAFPQVRFIVGHAGIFEYRDVMDLMGGLPNTLVDTSFQAPDHIRELVRVFGPERVMYASDWPWGDMPVCIAAVRAACRGDKGLERRLLYENAAQLLGLAA
jgi:hypothetical protein